MVKVSVIIPVYNSEQYLCQCLDSVSTQTLTEIEIICVDDCSTDFSKKILDDYAAKDARIKVLQNEQNRGQAFSRNRALEAAEGEYIQFLDSDDALNGDDALEYLYSVSDENELDLLKNEWIMFKGGTAVKDIEYPECAIGNVCSGKELLYKLELHDTIARITFSNFVKLEFLKKNKIRFYDGIIHEDILFSYDLFYYARRAMCVNHCTYSYVKHDNTTTTRKKDINHLKGHLVCISEILKKDFLCTTTEFRYATVKYLIRIYNHISNINKKLNYNVRPEMFDGSLKQICKLFLEKLHVNKEALDQSIDVIKQSENVYVYGAGNAAKELLELLMEYDVAIDGVFVTDTEGSSRTLLGHKVQRIDECDCRNENALFLVAITRKYVTDALDTLHARGYDNVIYVC